MYFVDLSLLNKEPNFYNKKYIFLNKKVWSSNKTLKC